MILSNGAILKAIMEKYFAIGDLTGSEKVADVPAFNTSALDLTLSDSFSIPNEDAPGMIDTGKKITTKVLSHFYKPAPIIKGQGFTLDPNHFVLAQTREWVEFPHRTTGPNFSARVEGKSSLARCGLLVHFTAPTIHAGFKGFIALEMANLGKAPIFLRPGASICQLIIEQVEGEIHDSANQFSNQRSPIGEKEGAT